MGDPMEQKAFPVAFFVDQVQRGIQEKLASILIEATTGEEVAPERGQPVLGPSPESVRPADVLDQIDAPTGLQHPAHLPED